MLAWLNTWRQENGAYNGFVVHRYDLKRLKEIHDTPWAQGLIIESLVNIYKKTNNTQIYEMAKRSAQLQMSRQVHIDGSYDMAGFEDDRFSSLVHNSLADRALIRFYDICNSVEMKEEIISVIKQNVDTYLIGSLWNEEAGAFKFSKVDYYSLKEDRYVANMNSVAVEVLIWLFCLTKDQSYLTYAKRCGELIVSLSNTKEGDRSFGGIGYEDKHPDNYVSIYTALTFGGVLALYSITKDDRYKDVLLRAAQQLYDYSENGLFGHVITDGVEHIYPMYVAGAGMILKAIDMVNHEFNTEYDLSKFIDCIMSYQLANGAVQNFVGYNTCDNARGKAKGRVKVWEDFVPCVAWNAHLLEFFSQYVDENFTLSNVSKTTFKLSPSFFYFESRNRLVVLSFMPLRSNVILIINKYKSRSLCAFTLRDFYRKIRH
jgi:uncharacterized protein YyaL (SSP411 family)